MKIKTHRDNWSDITTIGRAQLYRGRYKDVALDLTDRGVVAELLAASARRSIEVDASARAELEAHGLTVTAAGAVVEIELVPRKLEPGELLAEGDLEQLGPAGAATTPIDRPAFEDGPAEGDQGDDGDEGAEAELEPATSAAAAAGRKGKGKRKAGGRA